jgi:hypothetical protein
MISHHYRVGKLVVLNVVLPLVIVLIYKWITDVAFRMPILHGAVTVLDVAKGPVQISGWFNCVLIGNYV